MRSRVMSLTRGSRNVSTELRLARLMRAEGIKGWRRHLPIPGRPTVARVPFLPKVSQPPRPPTDTEVPDLERLRRSPLKREIRRLKRKAMGSL